MNEQITIRFTVFTHPEPQGSMRAFMPKGWQRPILTSDNPKLKSYRKTVSAVALKERQARGYNQVVFGKHEPVTIKIRFFFEKPASASKRRHHTVKPDADKISRSVLDSLTDVIYSDDSQIVRLEAEKFYGDPERVEIEVSGAVTAENKELFAMAQEDSDF